VTLLQILQPGEQLTTESGAFEKITGTTKDKSYTPLKVLRGLIGPVPLTVLNYTSSAVDNSLRSILAERAFDAVQLESSHLFRYLDTIRNAPGRPAVLLDWHNIESELMARYAAEVPSLPKRLVAGRTATLLKGVEQDLLQRCDGHTVVSEREREQLLARKPGARVWVVPNGVELRQPASDERTSQKDALLFVGSMDYHANIEAVTWFARRIWPSVSANLPELRFVIAGRSPAADVQALASGKVEVTGTVDDVRPYYARALAVVVPLRVGGGTRLKILEAMALGVPVVSTRLGAEGIAVQHGENILLADTEAEMEAAIGRIASQPDLRRDLSQAGRRLVEQKYDWEAIGNDLYQVHQTLAVSRARQ
jgi:polysaccharide biosynthesis protein PslH